MSLTVKLLSSPIIAAATLLPIGQFKDLHAQENTNNATVTAVEPKADTKKEELREFVYKNRYRPDITYLVRDPNKYVVDRKDIKLALEEPSSFFALGIGQNPTTIEVLKKDKEIAGQVKQFVIENLTKPFVIGLSQNKFPIDEDIQKACMKKLTTLIGAEYFFAKNPTWKITEEHRNIARTPANFNTGFVRGLIQHSDYVPKGQMLHEKDREIMRNKPRSDFAFVLSPHEGFIPDEKDILSITETPGIGILNTEYACNVAKKIKQVKSQHLKIAIENINTLWAEGIALNPNWKNITEKYRQLARENPNTAYAESLPNNVNFTPNDNDITFADKNPNTHYGKAIKAKVNNILEKAKAAVKKAQEVIERKNEERVKAIIQNSKEGKVSEVDDLIFDKLVQSSKVPVLVDFWAPWCGPCLRLAPTVKEIAKDYKGKLIVVKLNIDENPKTSEKNSIRLIPALILFKDRKPVGNPMIGLQPKSAIIKSIEKNIEDQAK